MNLRLSMRNVFRFAAVTGSVLTMVFSPVAHGLQSEETLKKQIEGFISETQLSKRITYQEFWNKTKHLYSGQVYKDVERYFMQAPNELMPEFKVSESTSSTGEKIPTITVSEKGKSYTIQVFGEKTKFAKFNNVVLSENDLMLITPAMKRLMASDIKIKKAHDKTVYAPAESKFTGTPEINREMWKKMSPTQRAQFMLNLRFLWAGAQKVLEAKGPDEQTNDQKKDTKTKSKKTSSLEKWNNFFAMLNRAEADDATGVGAEVDGGGSTVQTGTDCVVAGYIGTYGKNKNGRMSCLYPSQVPRTSTCPNPCNGTIYGFESPGKQFCVSDTELKTATHYNGACDKKMPLTAMELSLPAKDSKTGSARYQGIVEKNEAEALKSLKESGDVQKLTKDYLASMLSSQELKDAFINGQLSDKMLLELKNIQTQFNDEIKKAREACAKAADKKQFDPNFQPACDQLHKRFLFVADYLVIKPGCPDNKSVNPETLKCKCEEGEVLPGTAKCPVKQPEITGQTGTAPIGEGGSEVQPIKCTGETVASEDGKSCVCENGKPPKENGKCDSGFNWKPWLIGAGVLATAGLLWFLLKKKKKDQPTPPTPPQGCQNVCPANTAQNPTTCACDPIIQPPTCIAPKVLTNNVCACPATNACTPGQQVYNLSTCQCDTVVQQGVCPDGVTPFYTPPGPSTCPAPTLCQDGTQVYPPNTCPPVNEGGNGNNCPSGDCSGGVPTGN